MLINFSYSFTVTYKNKVKTKILYSTDLPDFKILADGPLFFIVDERAYQSNSSLRQWLSEAESIYRVQSGEKLKDLNTFPMHMKKILKITENLSHRQLTLVAVGGGSLGDFSGFVAATLKRGVRLIQIPTTWLAAMDSSHGGKNALNVGSLKNQIGTFHHPDLVCISRIALSSQAPAQHKDALGELYKMALIEGNKSWGIKTIFAEHINEAFLWQQLPFVVKAKYKIVNQDPDESKGLRYILNFGHTIGHVLELELNLSHGNAVSAGLLFALWYSLRKKLLSKKEWEKLKESGLIKHCSSIKIAPISRKNIKLALLNDKKKDTANLLKFIFLIKPGAVRILPVSIDDLIFAYQDFVKLRSSL
jgi:3-dehydroquinate synthase